MLLCVTLCYSWYPKFQHHCVTLCYTVLLMVPQVSSPLCSWVRWLHTITKSVTPIFQGEFKGHVCCASEANEIEC